MDKVSAMASHMDISLMMDRDRTSLISMHLEEPNKESKTIFRIFSQSNQRSNNKPSQDYKKLLYIF